MKMNGGMAIQIHVFLTSALVGGKWSASCPGRFTPGDSSPVTHWIEGGVGSEKARCKETTRKTCM
jgi:hypothetical protein